MKTVLHQVQRIFVRHLLAKESVYQGIEQADKEEMMLTLFRRLLERVFQGTLQKLNRHGRRHVEHLAAVRHLAVVTVIREFSLHQRFAVINAARVFANGVLHILGKERLEPELAGLVSEVAAEGHRLVAREKRRKTLGAHAQVQMRELDLRHLRFAIRASIHMIEYSYFYI